ncbi:flavin-containing monooxygenase [Nocardioides campestrisoli]|uniref:flavin-containing monooxygenase n=1 Tax=Nocardioides campestrisoli TaxID=2736757 RepID=UPI0015E696EB|nr:NAD(P)/FAD-dependent oxidoreductase [Nocardioides campestrisoli]
MSAHEVQHSEGQHVDVLIIGAGLSGVGAASQLSRELPGKSYLVLERRPRMGGTWDLFRYPGVRSDSDMFTLGYRFKPWRGEKALADGASILEYVKETAAEHGVDRHVRYDRTVRSADWDSDAALWTVTVETRREDVGGGMITAHETYTCSFLWACSGYYDYDRGYLPELPGLADFGGTVVHPQHWPEGLDYAGKRVVVIGSGATAVTLVPAMALPGVEEGGAAHVTMLQRSPTYVLPVPGVDKIGRAVKRVLPEKASYVVTRWKNVAQATLLFQASQKWPGPVRRMIRKLNAKMLPEGYPVDVHFKPTYGPWDQRMCLVPDGDLFAAIRRGDAAVATGTIETFDETGIRLTDGTHLDADLVVTATGLNLLAFGGMELSVDGKPVDITQTMAYKAMMLSGVPNFAYTIGYTNASWTLKADLVAEYVCRLLAHLDETGARSAVPVRDPEVGEEPFMDFGAGYVLRALDRLPKQGSVEPWKLRQNYVHDVRTIRRGAIDDGVLAFR